MSSSQPIAPSPKNRLLGLILCALLAIAIVTGYLAACSQVEATATQNRSAWWMESARVQERHGIPRGALYQAALDEASKASARVTELRHAVGYLGIAAILAVLAAVGFTLLMRDLPNWDLA